MQYVIGQGFASIRNNYKCFLKESDRIIWYKFTDKIQKAGTDRCVNFVFRRIYVLISMLYFVYFSYISILEKSTVILRASRSAATSSGFFAGLTYHGNLLLNQQIHLQDVLWPLWLLLCTGSHCFLSDQHFINHLPDFRWVAYSTCQLDPSRIAACSRSCTSPWTAASIASFCTRLIVSILLQPEWKVTYFRNADSVSIYITELQLPIPMEDLAVHPSFIILKCPL